MDRKNNITQTNKMMKKLNKNNLKHALDPLVCGKGKKGTSGQGYVWGSWLE